MGSCQKNVFEIQSFERNCGSLKNWVGLEKEFL
jgi:hypothetical protein